jgi:hypothetical protein
MRFELGLNLLGTLDRIYNRGEIDQERIPNGFDDVAVMGPHGLLDELIMDVQQAQHADFIAAHLTAEAHDVGEHDRGQASRLGGPRVRTALYHGGDYRARGLQLSNRASLAFSLPGRG